MGQKRRLIFSSFSDAPPVEGGVLFFALDSAFSISLPQENRVAEYCPGRALKRNVYAVVLRSIRLSTKSQ